jgi:hypothetical protein
MPCAALIQQYDFAPGAIRLSFIGIERRVLGGGGEARAAVNVDEGRQVGAP